MNLRHLVGYVAGPYRAPTPWGVHQNIQAAEKVAAILWQAGVTVICPHKNTAYFGGFCPDEAWLEGDLEIIRRCDFIVMMAGWCQSKGAVEELREAQKAGLPVFYAWNPGFSLQLPRGFEEWLEFKEQEGDRLRPER